jgi:hypothetical protein
MTPNVDVVAKQLSRLREELVELEETFPRWDHEAINLDGSRRFRSIGKRIVGSARQLEELIRANTFQRP